MWLSFLNGQSTSLPFDIVERLVQHVKCRLRLASPRRCGGGRRWHGGGRHVTIRLVGITIQGQNVHGPTRCCCCCCGGGACCSRKTTQDVLGGQARRIQASNVNPIDDDSSGFRWFCGWFCRWFRRWFCRHGRTRRLSRDRNCVLLLLLLALGLLLSGRRRELYVLYKLCRPFKRHSHTIIEHSPD